MSFYARFSRALGSFRPEDVSVFIGSCFSWSMQHAQSENFIRAESREAQAAQMLRLGLDALLMTVGVPVLDLSDRSNQLATLAAWLGEIRTEVSEMIALGANRLARLDADALRAWYLDMLPVVPDLLDVDASDKREIGFNITSLWLGRIAVVGADQPIEASIAAREWFIVSDQALLSPVWLGASRQMTGSDRWPWRAVVEAPLGQCGSIGWEAVAAALARMTPERVALLLEGPSDPTILAELDRDRDSGEAVTVDAMFRGALAALMTAGQGDQRDLHSDSALAAIYEGVSVNATSLSEGGDALIGAFLRRLREMLQVHSAQHERSDLDRALLATKFSLMTALARGTVGSPTGAEMGAAVWFMNHFDFEP